jgi:hypothetical protein
VEQGIAALWQEVLLAPLNSPSVTHWPWLFSNLEEEVGAILCLQAEEAEACLEEVEAQQHRIPCKYPSPQWPTSGPWELLNVGRCTVNRQREKTC